MKKTTGLIISVLGIFAVATVVITAVAPKPPALIPRAVLFGNPERALPQLSPDGKQLAFLAPDEADVLNVWLLPAEETATASPVRITSDKLRGVRQYLWQYDNRHLLYLQDVAGDENWHVYQTDLSTHNTRDLTPFQGIRADIIAYEPSRPSTLLVQMNLRERSHFDVYRIDLLTGAVELDTPNPDSAVALVADHDLAVRAVHSYLDNGGLLIRVRDQADSPWRELMRWGPEEVMGSTIGFSPDNQALYMVTSLGNDTTQLLQVDIATGQQTILATDPHYDVENVLVQPKTHAVQAVGVERDRFSWILLDPDLREDFKVLEKLAGPSFHVTNRTLDDRQWIVTLFKDTKPASYYLYDREKQNAQFLFNSRPSLDSYTLSPMQPISFQARDGMTLHGYLTLPAGYRPNNLPTVLMVHGGPWTRDQWGFSPSVQWLANRGYAVLQVNYRGSRGYGKIYLNAGNREWGARMQDDLIDAKKWAIEQGYSDPNKIAIYGGSYGGYATLAALAFTPEEFCCGVSVVGVSNLTTFLKTIPPYWQTSSILFDKRIGRLDEDEEMLKDRSPVFRADQIRRPLLIAHGAKDPRVNQAESDQIVSAMHANHQKVEYLLFPDEGHGFVRPVNKLKFYAAAEHFLSQQLGGREQLPGATERWDDVRK